MFLRVTLAVTLALMGCGGEGSSQALSSGAPETAETGAAALTGGSIPDDGIIVGNALRTRALLFNSLSTNPWANDAVTQNPLSSMSFATVPALRGALEDPDAREFFGYMVGCALPEGASVSWTSSAGAAYTFRGELGLCKDWQSVPAGERVSSNCQELVSACILARNNAFGLHVPLSVRGDDSLGDTALKAGSRFRAYNWRDSRRPVASMNACSSYTSGVSRNCGFRPGYVRKCAPGTLVTVAAGAPSEYSCNTAPPLGEVTSGDMVLRACEGLSSCDAGTAEMLDASEGLECSNYPYMPTLTFTCPVSGLFNVMEAPYASNDRGSVKLGESGSEPEMETKQFAVREGAFYGNLFVPSALAYHVRFSQGQQIITAVGGGKVVYKSMHTCGDENWSWSAEYAAERICTGGYCAAELVGVCQSKCEVDTAGDGEFRQCWGGSTPWKLGLTTFLHQQCHLNSKNCSRK